MNKVIQVYWQCPSCGKKSAETANNHKEACPNGYGGKWVARSEEITVKPVKKEGKK